LRREGRDDSASPVCSCAHFLCASIAHETAGAARTRSSLRPLGFGGKRNCKTSDKTMSRECGCIFSRHRPGSLRLIRSFATRKGLYQCRLMLPRVTARVSKCIPISSRTGSIARACKRIRFQERPEVRAEPSRRYSRACWGRYGQWGAVDRILKDQACKEFCRA
jgi:hypothetical protein